MSIGETEKRFLRSGPKLQRKMSEGPIILLAENPEKYKKINQFRSHNEFDKWIIFDPFSGEIHISTYRHKRKTRVGNPPEEDILMQRGKKPSEETYLRLSGYPDIEHAIRGVSHILDSYGKKDGEMVVNTKGMIGFTKHLLDKFRQGAVNKENIDEIAKETAVRLGNLGFLDAKKPIRQDLAMQIISAAGLDKMQRVNPLISRTRLASAWLKATRELLVADIIRRKFSAILIYLTTEREFERFYLTQGANLMQETLESKTYNDLTVKVNDLKEFCFAFFIAEKLKASPYRNPAIVANYFLFGAKDWSDKNLLAKMLGDVESRKILALRPIDRILTDSKNIEIFPLGVQERVKMALESINGALRKGDENLEES